MKLLRNLILILPILAIFSFSGPNAAIEWKFTEYDFGKIKKNKPVTIEFEFKNPGMIPLIIEDVQSSCGCTVPDYPKQPIKSGASAKITVTFDAKTTGYFSKTITVKSNTDDGVSYLYIKGEVI